MQGIEVEVVRGGDLVGLSAAVSVVKIDLCLKTFSSSPDLHVFSASLPAMSLAGPRDELHARGQCAEPVMSRSALQLHKVTAFSRSEFN